MAGGRPPKEKSFANMLNIALKEPHGVDEDGNPVNKLRQIATVLVQEAINGESWAIKEVADRVDGKAMQQVALTDEDGGPVVFRTIYEAIKEHK